jgi:hypothetical protein
MLYLTRTDDGRSRSNILEGLLQAMTKALLSELLVIDLSRGVAGAYCCLLFRHLGAEVVRADSPNQSSAGEPYLNAGKKSITLDVSRPEGVDLLRRLAGHADVLVSDRDLPLPYEALSRQNPRLMLTRIIEASNRDGFAAYFTGLNAFAATMLPLVNMAILGRGQQVEVDGGECLAAAAFVVDDGRAEIGWPESEGDDALPPFTVVGQARGPAPTVSNPGEHNDEVYCGLLGLSGEELVRLKEASVI